MGSLSTLTKVIIVVFLNSYEYVNPGVEFVDHGPVLDLSILCD